MAQKATVRKKPPPFQLWCWAFLLGMSMFERGLSGQAGRCQWRPKDVFSHTPLCFGNVDVLFSCLRCILSFHADTHASIKFLTWCWDFHQTRCTQLLICLSLEGNGAPGFFYLPCFWDPLFGNSWRTRLVVEAKIPMPLCAFSWRLSFFDELESDRGLCLVRWHSWFPTFRFLLPAAVWVDGSEAYWD